MSTFRHSFNRRCRGHDYRGRWIYMITILKNPAVPVFSVISADPSSPKVKPVVTLSKVGQVIEENLYRLCHNYPELKILCQAIMPDHVHFEVFVQQRTELTLGSMIASFKSACSKEFGTQNTPLFDKGFNDKIAFKAGAKDAFFAYIEDNPRRYLIKKMHSDYFFHKVMINICGRRCGLYGNLFLLDNPVKSFVKISRDKAKMPDLEERKKDWEETIRCGGVLVSPFINPAEKEIRNLAIENETGIIIVLDYKFSERGKPYKSLFDLCADGRLLIVSTEEFESAPKQMHYAHAQELNGIAAAISALPPRQAQLSPR